ncbi:hypothetical protein [Oxalicibacterium solurbis]|uniref:hypothetical protein n=1 Tax=Oxalicibacterium solurbis TaxID=69280 RepID=UPI001663EF87|nr:hypothetical protein [Oxalicibacterium solurbis]
MFSNNLPNDIKAILPEIKIDKLRGEADFYGISSVIAKQLGLLKVPRSYSMWRHGWMHQPLEFVEQVIWQSGHQFKYLVATKEHANFLKTKGINNARAVGLPFVYIPDQKVHRKKNSLLLMPAHSLPYVNLSGYDDEEAMISMAISLQNEFELVCFCVHGDCVKNGRYIKRLDELQIPWFVGASASDSNSLIRLRRIFEYFDVVGSNVVGSHMVYSQYCGARFFFIEPYFTYRSDMFREDRLFREESPLKSHLLKYSSLEEVRKNFKNYFVKPHEAICDQAFSASECGADCKIPVNELRYLLGWSLGVQLLGFIRSSLQRCIRLGSRLRNC